MTQTPPRKVLHVVGARPNFMKVAPVMRAMAATLVAAKLGIRTAHVEAGLRSFDRGMPEEINRLVTDALAELLLTPSPDADENLRREGVPEARIRQVGNVMIDTLAANLERARAREAARRFGVEPRRYVYVTLHRPSNVDERDSLAAIVDCLLDVSRRAPVVFPVHPRTRQRLSDFGLVETLTSGGGVKLVEPVGYLDSICLTDAAACVLTDSGGLQEETTFLRVPCLTLRPNTERPVTISEGSNRLTTLARLRADLDEAMQRRASGATLPCPALWDGKASERIADAIAEA